MLFKFVAGYSRCLFLDHNGDDVAVFEFMLQPDALPRMFRGRPPNIREPEFFAKIPVQPVTNLADTGVSKNDHRLFQIRGFTLRFHVNANETEAVVKDVF